MSSGLKMRTNQAEGERKREASGHPGEKQEGRGGEGTRTGEGAGALAVLQKPLSVTSLVLFKHM